MIRKIHKVATSLITILILGAFSCRQAREISLKLDLMQLQDWTIILSTEAIPAERYAAEEFQILFETATGINLAIADQPSGPIRNIFIGPGPAMRASTVGFRTEKFGEEMLQIRIQPDNIAIAGGRPRGTLYGVYEFFERYLGVRFLTYDHFYFPPVTSQKLIPCEEYSYEPAFSFRWSYYRENLEQPEFAARLRINTVTEDARLGGISSQRLINHSFHRQIPVARYGKAHPEYFALVKGERKLEMFGGGPEPCVTHPQVIDIVANSVLDELAKNPQAGNVSVSQNDNDAYCRCPNCEAINQREGSPMGAHLTFVNAVAERVVAKYPKAQVGTLAYWYTRKPPKTVRPRENVQIQLANIESCVLHAIDDTTCPKNKAFLADFNGWSQIARQIYIWTYMTNFRYYDLPFPNLRVIGRNLNYLAHHNVKGIFAQSNGGGTSGEFSDLRNYVISRCLWHPDLDGWQQVEEFCRLHYGKAAPVILDYINFFHDYVEENGKHPDCFATPGAIGLNAEVADRIFTYFNRALELADDPLVRSRVEKLSITAYRTLLEAGYQIEFAKGRLRRTYPAKYGDVVERYIDLCTRYKLTMPDERTSFDEFEKVLRSNYSQGLPAERLENSIWRLTVLPEDNGKVVEMLHKPSGRNLLSALQNNFMYGSFEEWGQAGYNHEADPAKFSARKQGNQLILTGYLKDGSEYVRKLTLEEAKPGQIACETRLTHRGVEPKTYQFLVHPEFHTGTSSTDFQTLSAYVHYKSEWVLLNQDLVRDEGPGTHLLVDAKDGGVYAFFNHEAGYGILETFDPTKIQKMRTWWRPDFEIFNLELLTQAFKLNPGESFGFTYAFEFLDQAPN